MQKVSATKCIINRPTLSVWYLAIGQVYCQLWLIYSEIRHVQLCCIGEGKCVCVCVCVCVCFFVCLCNPVCSCIFHWQYVTMLVFAHMLVWATIPWLFPGIPIRTTLDNSTAVQYAGLLRQLMLQARSTVRDVDPQNDLTCLRIRSKKHEIMVAPGRHIKSCLSEVMVTIIINKRNRTRRAVRFVNFIPLKHFSPENEFLLIVIQNIPWESCFLLPRSHLLPAGEEQQTV